MRKVPSARKPRRAKRQPARLLAVEVGGVAALGGDVRLELEPRRTVLVGWNAVGKSALLEAIRNGMRQPLFPTAWGEPHRLQVEIDEGEERKLSYAYRLPPPSGRATELLTDPDTGLAHKPEWTERCWRPGERRPLWSLRKTKLVLSDGEVLRGLEWSGLISSRVRMRFAGEVGHLVHLLVHCRLIRSGIPREERPRAPVLRQAFLSRLGVHRLERRLDQSVARLVLWFETDRATFGEFVELGRRLGLFRELEVIHFNPDARHGEAEGLISLEVDGVNAGLLSDGTQRVIEMLVALLDMPPGGLLLIEEPETGIHPGMLIRLLQIIESYSLDRQVVFSTHSPVLVSHSAPEELRLVERTSKGVTTVRKLSTKEASQVSRYLEGQGTLGDFVYSGGLDGES
jgi:predicted ATPase